MEEILKKIAVRMSWNAIEKMIVGRNGSNTKKNARASLKAIEKKIAELNELAEKVDSSIRFKFEYEVSDKDD